MKKQNYHPNKRIQTRQKKYSDKTPDSKSSKGGFKPRFIVKDLIEHPKQQKIEILANHNKSGIRNVEYSPYMQECPSPQYTEQISMTQSKNWHHEYQQAKGQLQSRTNQFNQVISLCNYIMRDIYKHSNAKSRANLEQCEEKLVYVNEKAGMLLDTFQFFQNKH